MKKVLCLHTNIDYVTITAGKVYDVISFDIDDTPAFCTIVILNDNGDEREYYIRDPFAGIIFKDITTEYRNDVIDEILT